MTLSIPSSPPLYRHHLPCPLHVSNAPANAAATVTITASIATAAATATTKVSPQFPLPYIFFIRLYSSLILLWQGSSLCAFFIHRKDRNFRTVLRLTRLQLMIRHEKKRKKEQEKNSNLVENYISRNILYIHMYFVTIRESASPLVFVRL